MKIITDNKSLEEPKTPETCNVFKIYSSMASIEEVKQMEEKYKAGNYGYGHAKQELFELILSKFETEREKYNFYMDNVAEIEKLLQEGEEKAREIARPVVNRVRKTLGFS